MFSIRGFMKKLFLAFLLLVSPLHAQVNCSGGGVACGGTGATSFTINGAVVAGSTSTSALTAVAPGSNGNVLTSNGTTWTSSAGGGSGVTAITGTANQVIADMPTGGVTLSLPQDVALTSAVGFGNVAGGVLTNKTGVFYSGLNTEGGYIVDAAGGAPRLLMRRAGGTQAALADVANGSNGMRVLSRMYSGGTYFDGSEIDSSAEGTWSSGQAPGTNLLFYTRAANSTQNLALTIGSDQKAVFVTSVSSGTAAGATGLYKFIGTTSGAVSLSVADAAGTYTMKLPTVIGAANTILTTDGSGQSSWTATPSLTTLGLSSTLTMGTSQAINSTTSLNLQVGAATVIAMSSTATTVTGFLTSTKRIARTGSVSSAAWGTSGISMDLAASSITDSTSSGTVATNTYSSINTPTLLASSATTYTVAASAYIAAAPVASTNVTITNGYALYVAAGRIYAGSGEVIAGDFGSGLASTLTLTNAVNTTLTNAYTVKGGQAATTANTTWIKIYNGTTVGWIPVWENATP